MCSTTVAAALADVVSAWSCRPSAHVTMTSSLTATTTPRFRVVATTPLPDPIPIPITNIATVSSARVPAPPFRDGRCAGNHMPLRRGRSGVSDVIRWPRSVRARSVVSRKTSAGTAEFEAFVWAVRVCDPVA
jgi:hypothetical protein